MTAAGGPFYDGLETRDPEEREAALMSALAVQVAAARAVPAYAQSLAELDPGSVTSRDALARLPVTRKAALYERQQAGIHAGGNDPFGGFSAIGWRALGAAARVGG